MSERVKNWHKWWAALPWWERLLQREAEAEARKAAKSAQSA